MCGMLRDVGVGAAAAYGAGKVMGAATTWFLERQSEASRRQEEELTPGGAPMAIARRLAGVVGTDLTDDQAMRAAVSFHRGLTTAYGVAAVALVRGGARPLRAGVAVGTAAFLLVDEGVSALGVIPRPPAYPLESHLRGLVGHLTFGVATGGMLALARRLGAITTA
ncbi:hypothetical protein BH20ACT9_BH20ACT9_02680 [soil metagenome]